MAVQTTLTGVQFLAGRFVGISGGPSGASFCANDIETETLGDIDVLTHPTNSGDCSFTASRFVSTVGNEPFCSNDIETETLGDIVALTHQFNSGECAFSNSRFV